VLVLAAIGIRVFRSSGGQAPATQSQAAQSPQTSEPAPAAPPEQVADTVRHVANAGDQATEAVSKAAAAATGVGDLRVTSNPAGAMVTVDGVSQDYYVTPFNTPPLKSGTHTLTATIQGLPPQSRDVEVVARKRTVVDFQLTGNKAIYNIASAPQGADILIDGTPIGARTPSQVPLPAGSHKVTLRMDGFEPAELMTQSAPGESVNIAPRLQARNSVDISGQVTTETPSLGSMARMRREGGGFGIPEGKGAVIIRTRPKGVSITVDGFAMPRQTPLRFPMRAGSHTVTLQKAGFQSLTRTIQVEEGKVTELDELLLPQ